jgi:hypothetical protein
MNVFRRGDDYFFYLTYGSDVQWVKNVLAAGSCSIETRGGVVELVEPELVTDPEFRPAPPHVRFVERRIAAKESTSAAITFGGRGRRKNSDFERRHPRGRLIRASSRPRSRRASEIAPEEVERRTAALVGTPAE